MFVVALLALLALASAGSAGAPPPQLLGQGFSGGGGQAYGGILWLTEAFGQPFCGRAAGPAVVETADWLRLPAAGALDVPGTAPAAERFSFEVGPNPVVSQALLTIRLPASGGPAARLRVRLYDISGRAVREMFAGAWPAGEHLLRWDGRDARGATVPAGVYLCRLETPSATTTRRLVLVH